MSHSYRQELCMISTRKCTNSNDGNTQKNNKLIIISLTFIDYHKCSTRLSKMKNMYQIAKNHNLKTYFQQGFVYTYSIFS